MQQVRSTDWIRHIPTILKVGAILTIISLILPSAHVFETIYGYSFTSFFWYFGLIYASLGGHSDILWTNDVYGPAGDDYIMYGIIAMIMLFIAFIFMIFSANYAKNERDNKLAAGTSLVGGILSFIGPSVFYFGVKDAFGGGFWGYGGFDPSFAIYLPIIGGILGIIGAFASGYAYSLQIKRGPIIKAPYTPIPDKVPMEEQVEAPGEIKKPNFCKNCGAKLVGPYCQSCGAKVEF